MQLLSTSTATLNAYGVEWIKILENTLVIVEAGKMEAVTNGEWRASICRCLMIILNEKKSSKLVCLVTIYYLIIFFTL